MGGPDHGVSFCASAYVWPPRLQLGGARWAAEGAGRVPLAPVLAQEGHVIDHVTGLPDLQAHDIIENLVHSLHTRLSHVWHDSYTHTPLSGCQQSLHSVVNDTCSY